MYFNYLSILLNYIKLKSALKGLDHPLMRVSLQFPSFGKVMGDNMIIRF